MKTTNINRREWLKKGILTAGAAVTMPYLSFAETPGLPIPLDNNGDAIYSPFFKEYLPENARDFPILDVKKRLETCGYEFRENCKIR